MRLSPRLAWRKWRRRKWTVPLDGRPLSEREQSELEAARAALLDEEGTRRVAAEAAVFEMLAADMGGGAE